MKWENTLEIRYWLSKVKTGLRVAIKERRKKDMVHLRDDFFIFHYFLLSWPPSFYASPTTGFWMPMPQTWVCLMGKLETGGSSSGHMPTFPQTSQVSLPPGRDAPETCCWMCCCTYMVWALSQAGQCILMLLVSSLMKGKTDRKRKENTPTRLQKAPSEWV